MAQKKIDALYANAPTLCLTPWPEAGISSGSLGPETEPTATFTVAVVAVCSGAGLKCAPLEIQNHHLGCTNQLPEGVKEICEPKVEFHWNLLLPLILWSPGVLARRGEISVSPDRADSCFQGRSAPKPNRCGRHREPLPENYLKPNAENWPYFGAHLSTGHYLHSFLCHSGHSGPQ